MDLFWNFSYFSNSNNCVVASGVPELPLKFSQDGCTEEPTWIDLYLKRSSGINFRKQLSVEMESLLNFASCDWNPAMWHQCCIRLSSLSHSRALCHSCDEHMTNEHMTFLKRAREGLPLNRLGVLTKKRKKRIKKRKN